MLHPTLVLHPTLLVLYPTPALHPTLTASAFRWSFNFLKLQQNPKLHLPTGRECVLCTLGELGISRHHPLKASPKGTTRNHPRWAPRASPGHERQRLRLHAARFTLLTVEALPTTCTHGAQGFASYISLWIQGPNCALESSSSEGQGQMRAAL